MQVELILIYIYIYIYIDLSKAFDTLDYTILPEKLRHYGIRDTKLQLIKSYFSNREQITEVNGYKSKPLKIKTGVPQGTVLDHFYFCCISTISLNVLFFKMVMYADDTTLYYNIDNGHISSTMINVE